MALSLKLFSLRTPLRSLTFCRKYASSKTPETTFPIEVPQYTSANSLHRIYPDSRLDLTAVPDPPVAEDPDSFTGYIPMSKLTVRYARSGGPGGQHAHKTNTKVNVSFHLQSAEWIPESTRAELLRIVSLVRPCTACSPSLFAAQEQHKQGRHVVCEIGKDSNANTESGGLSGQNSLLRAGSDDQNSRSAV